MEWGEQIHDIFRKKKKKTNQKIPTAILWRLCARSRQKLLRWCQWHVLDKWKKIFWIVFLASRSLRIVSFRNEQLKEEKKLEKARKKKNVCLVPAGILSVRMCRYSMLRTKHKTQRGHICTGGDREGARPNTVSVGGKETSFYSFEYLFFSGKMCLKQNGFRCWNGTKIVW